MKKLEELIENCTACPYCHYTTDPNGPDGNICWHEAFKDNEGERWLWKIHPADAKHDWKIHPNCPLPNHSIVEEFAKGKYKGNIDEDDRKESKV